MENIQTEPEGTIFNGTIDAWNFPTLYFSAHIAINGSTPVMSSTISSLSDQTSAQSSTAVVVTYSSSTPSSDLASDQAPNLVSLLVVAFLIATVAFVCFLTSHGARNGINQLSKIKGEAHELAETQASALLQRARIQRDTTPITTQSIDSEMHYLRQTLNIYRAMPQTPDTLQRMFNVNQSLVDSAFDLLMVSHLPQSHIENVRLLCKELEGIAKKIKRTRTDIIAHFYNGHVLMARARLLERIEQNQETTSQVLNLFAKAFKSFYEVKNLSRKSRVTPDRQINGFISSCMLACAFIVSKYSKLAYMEGRLTRDVEYMSFRDVLRSQPTDELLERKMLDFDTHLHI